MKSSRLMLKDADSEWWRCRDGEGAAGQGGWGADAYRYVDAHFVFGFELFVYSNSTT